MKYKIGDWVLEISSKKLFKIVTNDFYPPKTGLVYEVLGSIKYDYGIRRIYKSNKVIGVDKEELDRDTILIKNKKLAKILYE